MPAAASSLGVNQPMILQVPSVPSVMFVNFAQMGFK